MQKGPLVAKQLPEDPMVRDLIGQIKRMQVSRRGLVKGAGVGIAGAGALSLAACATGAPALPGDGSGGEINWGNWTYYLDFDDEKQIFPTLWQFMEETNIWVNYYEDVDDNNTFYGKIKDQLALNQDIGYDTVCLTDWMVGRLINNSQIQKFDRANMPNVQSNMIPSFDNLNVDPGRNFSVPWQGVMAGIAWNKELVPNGIKTVDDLLKPELKGKVGVLSEMRDTMGIIMQSQGVDISGDWGDEQFDAALAWLDDALKSGQIARVKGNSYTQDLQKEDTWAAICWSGDIAILNDESGDRWEFNIPESGGTSSADAFIIPNGTDKNAQVEELVNFYYDPLIAAEVADYVWFATPVEGAQEAMEQVNPEQVNNTLIFPDDTMQSRLHGFRVLTAAEDKKYSEAFQKVLGN